MIKELVQNESITARRRIPVFMVDTTDGQTGKTGISGPTVRFSKSGAASVAGAGTWTEIDSTDMKGHYYYEATQGELDTIGFLSGDIQAVGALPFPFTVSVVAEVIEHLVTLVKGLVVADGSNSATSFKTDLTEPQNDAYNDAFLLFIASATLVPQQVRRIMNYNGTTKVITVDPGFTVTPADDDAFVIVNR